MTSDGLVSILHGVRATASCNISDIIRQRFHTVAFSTAIHVLCQRGINSSIETKHKY